MSETRIATVADRIAIDELRRSEYACAPQFTVEHPEAVGWDEKDQRHEVLASFDAAGMVATMRGIVVCDFAEIRDYMEAELPGIQVEFPCLVLTKAATRRECSRMGFNSLLRLHFVEAANRCGIRSLAGAVFAGAPRVQLMRELGYRFVEAGKVTYDVLQPRTHRSIGLLDFEHFEHAVTKLREITSELSLQFPWSDDAPLMLRTQPDFR